MRSSQSLDSNRGGFVSFFNELDTGKELCSDSVSCLRKLETKTMLVTSSHAPGIMMQIKVHAPQASLHSMRWME